MVLLCHLTLIRQLALKMIEHMDLAIQLSSNDAGGETPPPSPPPHHFSSPLPPLELSSILPPNCSLKLWNFQLIQRNCRVFLLYYDNPSRWRPKSKILQYPLSPQEALKQKDSAQNPKKVDGKGRVELENTVASNEEQELKAKDDKPDDMNSKMTEHSAANHSEKDR
ncbi:hypothetical protein CK203_041422 [Vitis vinifera]|uniref:Uncharacterized protein n=1 Tax=Vitis vinifera TaxID=29760 RepID=A0A438H695_VITVI|nr:hypothetical protein CK203_041422 [Vitis vinifera]